MGKRAIIVILLILIVIAGISIYFVLQNSHTQGKCGDGVCSSIEKKKGTCPEDCEMPMQVYDYSIDADGFFWGTEVYSDQLAEDIISDTLKIKYLKIRLKTNFFSKDGKTFSSKGCMPSANNCQQQYNIDDVVKTFKENSWSMIPMFTHNTADLDITTEDIDNYVNFVEWFVSRYKDDANIKYVELVNAPGSTWKGTDKQLLELNNKAYERLKGKYPDLMVGTPGFEYFHDIPADTEFSKISMLEYFLDGTNGAKFDFWAFHGYPTVKLGESGIYPPTKTALYNKYAGIEGIVEIRKKLDANSWQDRKIIDTEHVGISSRKPFISDEEDKLDAAYTVQELLLKRTLQNNGQFVLAGILPLKIIPRGGRTNTSEFSWGSLNSDGSETKTVKAVALLLSKLNEYKYSAHISGEFDEENTPWIEKFSAGNKELYIFFKPFKHQQDKSIRLDNEVLNYNLKLSIKPSSIILTDINGKTTSITSSQSLNLEAENSPKFLEVAY